MTTLAYVNNPDGTPISPQAPQPTTPVTDTPTPVVPAQTPVYAPATTTTTSTPVSPTADINKQQLANNIANIQANPIAPISTPTQPASISMPTVTPVTPQDTTTVTQPVPTTEQRSAEILSHLNQGLSTNPGLFSDINTFRNAYGYVQKSPEERSILDNFFNTNKPSTDSYLGALIAGNTTQGNNTPEFKQAVAQFRNISPYIHATDPTQLINAVSTGKLGSSDLTTIQKYNPALYQAYQKKQAVYNQANSVNTSIVGTAPNIPSITTALQNISDSATGTISSPEYDAYKRFLQQDPHTITAYANVDDSYSKLKQYNDEKAKAKADIETTYGNTLTDGAKSALLAKRVSQLDTIYGDPVSNVNNAISQLNTAISNGGFKYYENDYQNTVGKQLTAVNDYNTTQYLTKLAQNDPVTAVNALVKKYEDMGVYAQRTPQEIQQAVQDEMAKGKTLSEALGDLNTAFQSKTQFQNIQRQKGGTDWKPTNITRYNPATGANETIPIFYRQKADGNGFEAVDMSGNPVNINKISGGQSEVSGSTNGSDYTITAGTTNNRPDRNNNPGNVKIGDVGNGVDPQGFTIFASPTDGFNAMVKDITAKLTGNSKYSSKIKTFADLVKIYAPSSDGNDPTSYASIVAKQIGINANDPVSSLTDKATEIAAAIAKHEGFTGKINIGTGTNTNTNFDTNKAGEYAAYLNDSSHKIPDRYKGQTQQNKFIAEANAWKISDANPGNEFAKEIINLATQLKNNPGRLGASVGGGYVPLSDWADYETLFKSFTSKLAFKNITELKQQGATLGQLTDNDMKLISSAASTLSLSQSDEKFKEGIDDIIKKMQKSVPGYTPTSATTQSIGTITYKATDGNSYNLPTK